MCDLTRTDSDEYAAQTALAAGQQLSDQKKMRKAPSSSSKASASSSSAGKTDPKSSGGVGKRARAGEEAGGLGSWEVNAMRADWDRNAARHAVELVHQARQEIEDKILEEFQGAASTEEDRRALAMALLELCVKA